MNKHWWADLGDEKYWLEATDRYDLGVDLRAPIHDASGRTNWRYTLFREAKVGDVVLHYDSNAGAIVGWSKIAAPSVEAPIVWAARGSYARERNAVAEETDGYRITLMDFTMFKEALSLSRLRKAKSELRHMVERIAGEQKQPVYFPFELSETRELRPMQGYAFKVPLEFVEMFPELAPAIDQTKLASTQGIRNPPWDRDELILALDLYLSPDIGPIGPNNAAVIELSKLLGRIGVLSGRTTNPDYRNPTGVAMKLMNFRRLDPAYIAEGRTGLSRGGKDEPIVWGLYAGDQPLLHVTANAIRAAVDGQAAPAIADIGDDEAIEEALEGRILTRLHRVRERSRKLVEAKKAQALAAYGALRCEACGFDFEARYGERGRGFIEAHHTKPVHTLGDGKVTKLDDLALVCANCHRMIHARQPWLDLGMLRSLCIRT